MTSRSGAYSPVSFALLSHQKDLTSLVQLSEEWFEDLPCFRRRAFRYKTIRRRDFDVDVALFIVR